MRLDNLRVLDVSFDIDILKIFSHLQDNTLRELRLDVGNSEEKYFENQKKLEKIISSSVSFLNLNNMKVTKSLESWFSCQKELDQVCMQFESLESLHLLSSTFVNLSNLENLKNLKKFVLPFSHCYDSEKMIVALKSASLEYLEVATSINESLALVLTNCPNLCELILDLKNERFSEHYPDPQGFQNGPIFWVPKHQNLKKLTIEGFIPDRVNLDDTFSFMRVCENLETFSMNNRDLKTKELMEILCCCPKLKLLCIETRSRELFKIIKAHGKNLVSFHIRARSTKCERKVELEKLKKYFDGQFTHFKFGYLQGYDILLLKETESEEKCCKILLV